MSEVIDALKKYLKDPAAVERPHGGHRPYVTLTRQEGMFSHEVGRAIISHLDRMHDHGWNRGWELMDQQLCAWMIKTGAVPASFDEMVSERYGEQGLQQMVYEMLVGSPEQHDVRCRVARTIGFLLRFGRVVVVGSCAAVEADVLDSPGVRLRIAASEARRLALVQKAEGGTVDAVRRRLRDNDAARMRLLREHYRRDIDDPTLYDATFLADRLSAEAIARATVALLESRMAPHAARFQPPLPPTSLI